MLCFSGQFHRCKYVRHFLPPASAPPNSAGTSQFCESDTCAYPAQPCTPLSRDRCTYEYFGVAASVDVLVVRVQDSVVVTERNIPPIIHVEYPRSELCVCLGLCVCVRVCCHLSCLICQSFLCCDSLTPRSSLLHSVHPSSIPCVGHCPSHHHPTIDPRAVGSPAAQSLAAHSGKTSVIKTSATGKTSVRPV